MLPLRATTCPATTAKVYLRSAVHHANKLYPRDTKKVYQLLLKARGSSAHQNTFILRRPHSSAASQTPWTCGAVPRHMAMSTAPTHIAVCVCTGICHSISSPVETALPNYSENQSYALHVYHETLPRASCEQPASPRTCSSTSPLNLPAICFPLRKK